MRSEELTWLLVKKRSPKLAMMIREARFSTSESLRISADLFLRSIYSAANLLVLVRVRLGERRSRWNGSKCESFSPVSTLALRRRLTSTYSICSSRLPFSRTRHIRNSFNGNREIKVSRDGKFKNRSSLTTRNEDSSFSLNLGTEVEPAAGQALIDEFARLPDSPGLDHSSSLSPAPPSRP